MTPNDTENRLSGQQRNAAILLAADELSDEAIATQVGVGRKTLARWKLQPEMKAAIAEHAAAVQAAMRRLDIAKRQKSVAILDQQHQKLLSVIAARAEAYAGQAPGAGTGLLVKETKMIGTGREARVVEAFVLDVGLLRELRALQEQAAKELGQWRERHDVASAVTVQLVGVDVEAI